MSTRLKYTLYLALFKPLSWLPLWALYGLSNLLRLVMEHCLHYRRAVIRRNLAESYPDKSPAELQTIEHDFYGQLCDNIVETVKLLSISDRTMRKRVQVEGTELVEAAARKQRPVILYLGHYCNWEWVPAITLFYSEPKLNGQLYKKLHDAAFDRLMLKLRSRFGSVSIDTQHAFRELLRWRRDHRTFMIGFIADHRNSTHLTRYHTEFLRHDTTFYPGGEEIGDRIDAVYLYLDVEKQGRGRYRYEFKTIEPDGDAPDYPITRKYLQMLQTTIDRAPAYWLWSHRRWI